MDDEVLSLNLSTLEEFVLDEEKIVTYAYLSKKLCIHVNQSKLLLKMFLRKIRNNKSDIILNVKYIISGLSSDNKGVVRVLHEKDVGDFRSSMKHIFFEHIYSISKGTIVDDIALSVTKDFNDFSMAIGLIKGSVCNKHSLKEIYILKQNSQDLDKSDIMKRRQENLNKDSTDEKETMNNVSSMCLSPTKSKNSNENSSNESILKKQKLTKNTSKNQKGIVGFFNKQNESIKESNLFKTSNISVNKEVLSDCIETIHHNKQIVNDTANNNLNTKEKLPSENLEENKNINTETISISSIVKKAKIEKKRKRLLKVSDSDSEEDSFGSEKIVKVVKEEQDMVCSDNEIPPTPTTDIIKITSRKINPMKKKKIVDRTYTDEEGYILTKKEEVYETGSDSEDDKNQDETNVKKIQQQNIKDSIPETKEVIKTMSKKSKKKGRSPQKGKQVTMMNFFKKVP